MSKTSEKTHLGDGAYVRFDGYGIWLFTQEGDGVYLEPDVFCELIRYMLKLPEVVMHPHHWGLQGVK